MFDSKIFQKNKIFAKYMFLVSTLQLQILQFISIFASFERVPRVVSVFIFPNFLEILFLKNFHFMARWASWHVPPLIPKNRTQKHPELTSLQYFEIEIPQNF